MFFYFYEQGDYLKMDLHNPESSTSFLGVSNIKGMSLVPSDYRRDKKFYLFTRRESLKPFELLSLLPLTEIL